MVEMLNHILSASSQSESPNDKITSHKNVIKDDIDNFEASSSDSGNQRREGIQSKTRNNSHYKSHYALQNQADASLSHHKMMPGAKL